MIIKIESDQLKSLNFNIDFSSLLRTKTEIDQSIQKTNGYAPYHAEPSYRGNIENPIRFDKNRGIHFSNYVKIKDTDGKIKKMGKNYRLQMLHMQRLSSLQPLVLTDLKKTQF